jgi:acetoin utilization deacetylase AcuC-like enzyme
MGEISRREFIRRMAGLGFGAATAAALYSELACGRQEPATASRPSSPTPIITPVPTATLSTPEPNPTPQQDNVIIVYHPAYLRVYSTDPSGEAGRIESILKEIEGVPGFIFTKPDAATEEQVKMVHTQNRLDAVESLGCELYETALLSVGGAILASEVAMAGQVSMAINRPPGHHASPDTAWGYCYFNNIAIAITNLLKEGKIKTALIVDFDLHYGDGTYNIFDNPDNDDPRVAYYHTLLGQSRIDQLQDLEAFLSRTKGYDIIGVSAGFDAGKLDWGKIFEIEDYTTMGTLLKKAAERNCGGRRFAVLEGGYIHDVLGKNVKAFLDGFR